MTLPPAAAVAIDKHPPQASSLTKNVYQAKFDFPFSPNLPPPKVVTILNLIIRNWSDELSEAEFYGANNKKIGIVDFPTDKPSFDETFSLTTAEKQNRHIYALVEIRCFDKSFSTLKRSIWNILTKHNVFLRQHFLGFKQIEVSSPGWILQANPSFHSSDGIGDEIREFGKDILHNLSRKDIDDLAAEFPKFYNSNSGFTFPEMHLARRNLKGESPEHGSISADAFEVQVGSEDAPCLTRFLELFFKNQKEGHDYLFVPFSLRREDPQTYVQLLGKQNEYMDNHRNISVAGLSWDLMQNPIQNIQEYESFQDILLKQPGVYRVDCTRRTNDIGKWNISTDKTHYQDLIKWIDAEMARFFSEVPTSGLFTDFPEPCRLGRHRQILHKNPAMSSYAKTLRKRYGTASETGSLAPAQQPKRPAWNRPPIDIEYSIVDANFPPLPSNNKTDETKSTASSTKFTVSEDYKSIIAKEMSQYKADAALARSDLVTLKSEISNLVNQTINESLKGIIQEVHHQSATTYLTATEYRTDMSTFHEQFKKQTELITELSNQIREMQNPTPRKQRPAKKAHLTNDDIDIQPRSLNSSFQPQSPCGKSPFSSSLTGSVSPVQFNPSGEPPDSPSHMLE
jgi:hypothetical protein